jgi:hypothetical protein
MSNIKLNPHDARIAVSLQKLWDAHLKPIMTQEYLAQKYDFEQNFISQVFHFHCKATHALICVFAKELSIQPIDIDPLFNDPSRFRK